MVLSPCVAERKSPPTSSSVKKGPPMIPKINLSSAQAGETTNSAAARFQSSGAVTARPPSKSLTHRPDGPLTARARSARTYRSASPDVIPRHGNRWRPPTAGRKIVPDSVHLEPRFIEPKHEQQTVKNAEFFFHKGFQLCQLGEFEDSIKHYEKVLSTRPNHFHCLFNLGYSLMKLGKFDEAIELYSRMTVEHGHKTDLYFNRGICFYQIGKYQLAIDDFNTLLQLLRGVSDTDAIRYRGLAQFRLGEMFAAAHDYNRFFALDKRTKTSRLTMSALRRTSPFPSSSDTPVQSLNRAGTSNLDVNKSSTLLMRENVSPIFKSNSSSSLSAAASLTKSRSFRRAQAPTQDESISVNRVNPYMLGSGRLKKEALTEARELLTASQRNAQRLAEVCHGLKFFSRFPLPICEQLLESAHLVQLEKDEVVFRQGDKGELFYIVMFGSVLIVITKAEMGNIPTVVNTLYDGASFGELSIIAADSNSGQQGRAATVLASEPTDLIAIPQKVFLETLKVEMETELMEKLQLCLALRFFQNCKWFNILALMSHTETRRYNFGDVILAKGDVPFALCVIYSGVCKIIKHVECYAPIRRAQSASTRTGGFLTPPPPSHGQRVTFSQRSSLTKKMEVKRLGKGTFFGSNSMLRSSKDDNLDELRSMFDVVVESAVADVMIIKKELLNFLSDQHQNDVFKACQVVEPAERPRNLSEFKKQEIEFKSWERVKADIVYSMSLPA
eukprot:GILJ01007802.1.p1 GENE.GILJ01007802.1~~GILJ01007802.1.p1  ORF type:complete len:728 (-),score=100.01 GILJ01007802.1:446-2629(-)